MSKKTRTERYQGLKIILFLILCIAQIIVVSAVVDKSFSKEIGNYGKVELTSRSWIDIFGWFSEKVEDIELKENTFSCLTNCEATKEITLYQNGKLVDDVRFMNLDKTKEVFINSYQFYIKDGVKEITIDDYKTECQEKININGTAVNSCSEVKSGSHVEYEDVWKEYNFEEVKAGSYTLKLKGVKETIQSVDWQIKSQEKWVDDWAVWTSALNSNIKAYWNFNDGSGTRLNNTYNVTIHNGTLQNMPASTWTTGLLGGGLIFNGSNQWVGNITKPTNITNLANNYTLSLWFKPTENLYEGIISQYTTGTSAGEFIIAKQATGKVTFFRKTGVTNSEAYSLTSTSSISLNSWNHVVIQSYSNGTIKIYFNGTLEDEIESLDGASSDWDAGMLIGMGSSLISKFNGTIDEVGIWGRILTNAEISDLYNNGVGISYSSSTPIVVTLNYPPSGSSFTNATINFNATISPSNTNITNATINIWDSLNNLDKTNFTTYNVGAAISVNYTFTGLTGDIYHWNVYSCGVDLSSVVSCSWSETNRTFTISPYIVSSEEYNNITTEGNLEIFRINISTLSGYQVSTANLLYNGTSYAGTLTNPATNTYSIYKTIAIPNIVEDINKSFYWEIGISSGSLLNSSWHNQSILNFEMDNCSAYHSILYNFSLVDELTQLQFSPTVYNTSGKLNLQLYTLSRALVENYTNTNNGTSNFLVCLNSNLTSGEQYSLDLQIQYDASSYASEFYNIKNSTISASSLGTNITLYDLPDSKSQEFVISFKDSTFLPVVDALIQVQRKYVDEGVFKTVEIPITDTNGETIAHLQLADAIYTFIVTKNGAVLGTFSNVLAVCQDIILGNCDINLNSISSYTKVEDYTTLEDLTFTLTFDQDLNKVQSIFTIPSGTPKQFILNTTLYDALGTTEVCHDSLISSSGTLTCTIPTSVGNGTAIVILTSNGEVVGKSTINLGNEGKDLYGSNIMFLTLFLFLTLIGVGISSEPMITGFFLLLGSLIAIGLNLINTPTYFGAGATILWLFVAIVLVLIKGAKRQ
jgi:hypothetical protein